MSNDMTAKNKFTPAWYEGETPYGTYRALFRWNDPNVFEHPNRGFYQYLRDKFELEDEDFSHPKLDLEKVEVEIPSRLTRRHIQAFIGMVESENIREDTYSRTRASYGAGMIDALRLRGRIIEDLCDLVVTPHSREDIEKLVKYCNRHKIPVTVYGGGSTVTRGMEA